jgi:hypothetical protein
MSSTLREVLGSDLSNAAELGDAEARPVGARAGARRLHRGRHGRVRIQHFGQRHAGLAVDARVVHLAVQRHLAALQALDDVQLPQRPAAVHQRRVQSADELLQPLEAAGPRQDDMADVVVDVQVVVVHPNRVGQVEGHQRELALERADEVQPRRQVGLGILVEIACVALRQVEHGQAADVHRHLRRLEVQERGVHAAEVVHFVVPFSGLGWRLQHQAARLRQNPRQPGTRSTMSVAGPSPRPKTASSRSCGTGICGRSAIRYPPSGQQ